MGTIETIVAIVGGIVAAIAAAVGIWMQLRKPHGKPSIKADTKSTAIDGDVKNSAVASGEQAVAAVDKGVAIGSGQQGPIVIAQEGSNVSVSTNTTVRQEELQSEGPAVGDAYTKGVHLQAEHRHEEAIRAFERAFAATRDERNRAALHILISTSLLKLGRLPQAEGHLGEALDAVEDKSRKPKRLGKS